VSIINEALRKTQQLRKMEKTRREKTYDTQRQEIAPELQKPLFADAYAITNHLTRQKIMSMFSSKMAGYLLVSGLLVIMAVAGYQHAKNSNQPVMASAVNAREKMAFTGVFVSDNSRIAVINKQSFHLGDTVNGMKIVAINQDTIDLQQKDKIVRIRAGATYLL